MRVSQQLDYALRAVVDLARRPHGSPVPAGEIAESLGLPRRFVEQQITVLARSGIVACRRGTGGGCTLARDAADVTVLDVVRAIDGDVLDVPLAPASATAELWASAAHALETHLGRTTVADLARRQDDLDAVGREMYFI